ncbi:MAG: hypothetical protein M0Z54_03550 [Thermaerobacter sp.]|nr:hypothetical protein [Thermaerobacter sp.]
MNGEGPLNRNAYLRRVWQYLVALAVFGLADGLLSQVNTSWALVLQGLAIVLMLAALAGLVWAARRK